MTSQKGCSLRRDYWLLNLIGVVSATTTVFIGIFGNCNVIPSSPTLFTLNKRMHTWLKHLACGHLVDKNVYCRMFTPDTHLSQIPPFAGNRPKVNRQSEVLSQRPKQRRAGLSLLLHQVPSTPFRVCLHLVLFTPQPSTRFYLLQDGIIFVFDRGTAHIQSMGMDVFYVFKNNFPKM